MNLETPLEKIFRLNKFQKSGLKKISIENIRDLLYYFPKKYGQYEKVSTLKGNESGEKINIYAQVISVEQKKTFKTNKYFVEAVLEDSSGKKIKAIWFNQVFVSKVLKVNQFYRFWGSVSEYKKKSYLSNPEFKEAKGDLIFDSSESLFDTGKQALSPIYRETRYITSKWIYHKISKILSNNEFLNSLEDTLPSNILKKYHLPSLKNSFFYLHLPQKEKDIEIAKKRFAFEEVFFLQLVKAKEKQEYLKSGSFQINVTKSKVDEFKNLLDFKLTKAQNNAVKDIVKDLKSAEPMSRLLEGDVGSGKTVIAAALAYFVSKNRPKNQSFGYLQTAYMAPTEILATQIFQEFISLLRKEHLCVALLTGKNRLIFPSKLDKNKPAKISKKKLEEKILNGEVQIIIGTHALISKKVFFENLGAVIIDEQHRFGKRQRASLREKPKTKQEMKKKESKIVKKGLANNNDVLPHLLSMTATPIPRTLALSLYGDLDLTIMDELPPGRKKPITEIFLDTEEERKKVYESVLGELEKGHQAYVICPRISDPDPNKESQLNLKSAEETQKRLQLNHLFKKYKIGLLHSKLKKDVKNEAMNKFVNNKYQILVSTSAVEVGVSVKNATVIVIEGGERFGLSQLHQFRGRVMRSHHQPFCFIFTGSLSDKSRERLSIFKRTLSGFELAEADLHTRGAGEILGNKQSGMSDLAMEAIKNLKLVKSAKDEAWNIIENNSLEKDKKLLRIYESIRHKVYLE